MTYGSTFGSRNIENRSQYKNASKLPLEKLDPPFGTWKKVACILFNNTTSRKSETKNWPYSWISHGNNYPRFKIKMI